MDADVIYKPENGEKHPCIAKAFSRNFSRIRQVLVLRDLPNRCHDGGVERHEIAVPAPIGIDLESPGIKRGFKDLSKVCVVHVVCTPVMHWQSSPEAALLRHYGRILAQTKILAASYTK
jgi:hypothetical protein